MTTAQGKGHAGNRRRKRREKRWRDMLFQIADFDPWISVDGEVVCYFCRHAAHTEQCVFVEAQALAKRSDAYK